MRKKALKKRIGKMARGQPTRRTKSNLPAVASLSSTVPPAEATTEVVTAADAPPKQLLPLTIVGLGPSAGGLEAFSQLRGALPNDPGIAPVLVQHLAPLHESVLPALLTAKTWLPVVQATDGMRVARNTVYVIPPNVHMGITPEGVLHL